MYYTGVTSLVPHKRDVKLCIYNVALVPICAHSKGIEMDSYNKICSAHEF